MRLYLSFILLLPLLGGIVNTVAGRLLPRRLAEWLACTAVAASFGFALAAFLSYRTPVTVELFRWLTAFDFQAPVALYYDPLAAVMCLMVTFVSTLIHVYSVAYMAEEEDYARFFALLNLFVFAMLTLVLAENLPLLYLGWEGVGFCSYALIGFWYRDEKNATAGRKAFIVTRIGDFAFGIAVIWLFRMCGTISITQINGMGTAVPAGAITLLGLLFLVGAMGKSAQVPLMVWLPDAMAGPTPVSALIHAATMVTAGVYLLARMFPLIGSSATALAAIAVTGGVTAFYAATCALAQRDLKRALAYSTISQIGYMVLGVGCGAVTAATFHLLVHAFFKALLFLGAGCVIAAMHHEQDIFRMGGLARRLPLTFWPFLAGSACLAGFPFTGGFFSKDSILAAAWLKGGALYGSLYLLGMVTALLTAIYTFRLVYLVFAGPPLTVPPPLMGTPTPTLPHQGGGSIEAPRLMEAMLIPLALLGLCGGVLNLPAYLGEGWLAGFLAPVPGDGNMEASSGLEMVLQGIAGVVALIGLAIAHVRYSGERRARLIEAAVGPPSAMVAFFQNGWYVDALYRFLFVRPYEALARFFWTRVDEGVVDDSLDRFAALLGATGQGLGRWTNGRVSVYILSLAAGAALLLAYLAWVVL